MWSCVGALGLGVACIACAAPAQPRATPPVTAATGSAAPVDAATPAPDAAAAAVVAAPDDDPAIDTRDRFAWQQLRDDYEAFLRSPITDRCDIRRADYKSTAICPGPREMAGRVAQIGSGRVRPTGIAIDRGRKDAITLDWKVALLDDDGHPVTGWFPIDQLREDHRAYADLDISPTRAARYSHVGMRLDPEVQRARFAPLHPDSPTTRPGVPR
jgi:hypothetical protein